MKIFKNKTNFTFLTRDEMKNTFAGKTNPNGSFHTCGLDCRYQSPNFTCAGGVPPTCRQNYCTNDWGTSSDWSFSCGVG